MLKKIAKHLTNNLGLKVASILLAIIIWLVVLNIDDPRKTKTFSVPITVLNQEIIEEMGQVYNIVNQSEVAVFYVNGKRSYIDNLTFHDFRVTADLSQADFNQDNEIKVVPIEIEAVKYKEHLSITKKTVNMQITIEDLSTQQFVVSSAELGNPAEGYAIGETLVEPNLLNVSGPQSVVSTISRVVASINVEGVSSDVSDYVRPVLYDGEGNVVKSEQLKLSQDTLKISTKILGTKTVPVRFEVRGEPASGYQFGGLEYAPDQVTIKGEPDVLNSIIEVPGGIVDLDGAMANIEDTVDITQYLKDVALVNPEEGKIAFRAIIEKLGIKELILPIGDISVYNLGEGLRMEYVTDPVKISVQGLAEDLEQLHAGQAKASIDLEGLGEGVRTVTLDVILDETKYERTGTVTIRIRIVKIDAEDETEIESDNNGNNSNNNDDTDNGSGQNLTEAEEAITGPNEDEVPDPSVVAD